MSCCCCLTSWVHLTGTSPPYSSSRDADS
jgi:hypothetical protein